MLVDGDKWRDLHISVFGKKPRFENPIEPLDKWFYPIEFQKAKLYAYRKLAQQSLCSYTLEKMLKERRVSGHVIREVAAHLQEMGYLNDEEWIEGFVEGLKKKFGARAIVQKCLAKGIPEEAARPFLQDLGEKEAIEKLLQTKYCRRDLSNRKEREKVIASLMRKGFSFEAIRQSL